MRLFKKGYSVGDIPFLAITLGVAIIVMSIVGQVTSEVRNTQTANTTEWNISGSGQSGIQKMSNWFPTIGLVLGAVIIIGALATLFTMRMQS